MPAAAKLTHVVDERGAAARRQDVAARERTMLLEALALAVALAPRAANVDDIAAAVALVPAMAAQVHGVRRCYSTGT